MSFSPSPSNDDPNLDRAVPNSNSDSDSLSPSPTRPNRWVGAPSTWASLTFQERGLAASLDALRDADLSIHLYNAYNLKKRAHDVRNGRVKVEEEFAHLPEEDRIWEPPRYWTAWPLRPEDVPREGEKVGPEDKDEGYTFRRAEYEMEMPSGRLEEVLVGTTLRIAKEFSRGTSLKGLWECKVTPADCSCQEGALQVVSSTMTGLVVGVVDSISTRGIHRVFNKGGGS